MVGKLKADALESRKKHRNAFHIIKIQGANWLSQSNDLLDLLNAMCAEEIQCVVTIL